MRQNFFRVCLTVSLLALGTGIGYLLELALLMSRGVAVRSVLGNCFIRVPILCGIAYGLTALLLSERIRATPNSLSVVAKSASLSVVSGLLTVLVTPMVNSTVVTLIALSTIAIGAVRLARRSSHHETSAPVFCKRLTEFVGVMVVSMLSGAGAGYWIMATTAIFHADAETAFAACADGASMGAVHMLAIGPIAYFVILRHQRSIELFVRIGAISLISGWFLQRALGFVAAPVVGLTLLLLAIYEAIAACIRGAEEVTGLEDNRP